MSITNKGAGCDTCGCYMDIGAIISEEDNILTLPVQGSDEQSAMGFFDDYVQKAKARFAEVDTDTQWDAENNVLTGKLIFSCAAERIIFEMTLAG
ncbi:DUF406 family protein [Ferrimonas sp. YFM]|uniref:DUF406 family protein n=1 Tax=Ferrimonas sp. YFM TaxID=3028878 RepID=UPI002573EE3F|nr:DUF406 family protein [Ferrimonas sp. YFM]BDY05323.1 hypothetical protein F0521_23640 [Ferrimonas sp. YFM]